jgi:sugar fermentation stimulation protein A
MQLPSLHSGVLTRRYKRFLADIVLDDGREIIAHVANSGAMTGLAHPGARVFVAEKSGGKLGFSWELVEIEIAGRAALVGVNTMHPNRLGAEAIAAGEIAPLAGYATLRREVRYGTASRVDLLLEDPAKGRVFVEIKNVHLWRQGALAEFPDATTARGAKHLRELSQVVAEGARAAMLYVVQGPAEAFTLAADIDPAYAAAFQLARAAGVEAYAYSCALTHDSIRIARPVPIVI